ncbi:hypothetical protein F4805DRAFT_265354 [Annulohypoxylon moriforme]|nr:hypothetical protein F4805DRAFT_265354 [Annulohypoxylon moriforme]
MPKLISASRDLAVAKEEIELLKAKNSELEAENIKLKAYIKMNNLKVPREKALPITIQDTCNGKNYLAPTVASRNRCTKSRLEPSQPTPERRGINSVVKIQGEKYRYEDGRLIELIGTVSSHPLYFQESRHFQESTSSSRAKMKYLNRWRPETRDQEEVTRCEEDELDFSSPAENTVESIADILAQKSRLSQRLPEEFDQAPLKSQIIYNHLQRALRLSQKILFDGFSLYIP